MAMILDAFMPKLAEILVRMVQGEVGMLLDIPGEIEKLYKTVNDIQCVIVDAERRQIESMAIKCWLTQLKDVMYDADDIMDLCQIKAEERRDRSDSPSSSKVTCRFLDLFSCFRNPVFAHEIGTKIKEINSRLEGIAKRKNELGLIEIQTAGGRHLFHRVDSTISRKTDPVVVMDDLVGKKIEGDAELLLSWLTEDEHDVRGNIGVVAIVGMGGIGKTTLAKRIFNDSKLEEFQLKIWACVSKEVKALELLKSIIRQAGGGGDDAQERSELVPLLERVIKGKKFFLVLDDVWFESPAVWNTLLRAPMSGGAKGSRLLVTTRDKRVANDMKAKKSHHVEKMSDEAGWSLLVKQVFENDGESEIQELKNIGLELVTKCGGLPLAIKSLGGVLRWRNKTKEEWQAVLKSNVWSMNGLPNDIHQALYLSYEDLPSHLKQCFIHCSLYPEDHEFSPIDLVYRWGAEGFLQDNENLCELGNEYYMELVSRNLLEKTYNRGSLLRSKMHDLFWSFARYLGKDENLVIRKGETFQRERNLPTLRRLSIKKTMVNTQLLEKEKSLRTLLINDIHQIISVVDLCRIHHNLRILELSFSCITTLPSSIGALMHLRYLSVNCAITSIPESIGYLRKLIYLDLKFCKELRHVPRSIINLKELRYLGLSETKVEGIPSGLKKLENLNQLVGFKQSKSGSEEFSSLDELETLTHLRTLWLQGLEKVIDKKVAKRAKLHCKYKLKCLSLEYCEDQMSQTNEKKTTPEEILNELCPPPSLEILRIRGYSGSCLPNWLNLGTTLSNLKVLTIEECHCFENLPSLGQLLNLNELKIRFASSFLKMGEDILWGDIKSSSITFPAFPKLNKLYFYEMPNWREWQWNKGESAMPNLKELSIIDCPELRSLPEGLSHHATSLEKLKIVGVDNLTTVEDFLCIKDIDLGRNQNLERISNLSRVKHIMFRGCPNLKIMEKLNALQRMELLDYEMEVLPEYLMTIMPQTLRIYCNSGLLRKIASRKKCCSEWLKFEHIPEVTMYSSDESNYAIYQKEPSSFTTNITE